MTPEMVLTVGQEALKVTALLAGPILIAVLVTGLLIGMFQAVTQINEMTLSFIPKLMVLAVVLTLAGSWMIDTIISFTQRIFENIPGLIG